MVKFLMDWQLFIATQKKFEKKVQKRATLEDSHATSNLTISNVKTKKK